MRSGFSRTDFILKSRDAEICLNEFRVKMSVDYLRLLLRE